MQNSKKSGENPNANPFEVLADAERHVGRYNTTPFSDIGGFKESFSDDFISNYINNNILEINPNLK